MALPAAKMVQPACRLMFRPDSSAEFHFKLEEFDSQRRIIRHVGDMVKNIPGGWIFDLASTGLPVYPRLRGSSIQQSQITIDGFPVNHSQFGPYDLSSLPLAAFKTAEITHFNFTSISGNTGSVINLSPPENQFEHPTTRIIWQKGSFSDSEVDVEFGQQIAAQTTMVGAVTYQSSAGKFVHSEYNAQKFRCRLNSKIKPNWNLKYQLFQNRSDIDLPLPENWHFETLPKYFHRKANYFLHLLELRGNVAYDSLEDIRIRTYYSSLYQDFIDQTKEVKDVYRNRFWGLHVQGYRATKVHVLTYGANAEYRWLHSNRIKQTGFLDGHLFLNGSTPINSNHQLLWNSNLEINSKFSVFLAPKVAYQHSLSRSIKLEFSYQLNRRLPDFYELYWNRTEITGNPGLKTEKIHHSAFSVQFKNDNVSTLNSLFIKEIKNPIILSVIPNLNRISFTNQTSELISGYEHTIQFRPICKVRFSNQLEIMFNSNWKNSFLVNYPQIINRVIVDYENFFFDNNLQAGIRVLASLIGRHWNFNSGLYDYPPYFISPDFVSGPKLTPVIELGLLARISSFRIQFSLENLLMEKHQSIYGYPMRELGVWLSINWLLMN